MSVRRRRRACYMSPMDLILTNARVVTRTEIVLGSVAVKDGTVRDLARGTTAVPGAVDVEGDLILPGLIDLHTDALERHLEPRPGVYWPTTAALIAHDRQMTAAGITTVFDSLYVGSDKSLSDRQAVLEQSFAAMEQAQTDGLLKADHFLHLRCELPSDDLIPALEKLIDDPFVRLISVMDHTPGQRQWSDLDKWYLFHSRSKSRQELDDILADRERRQNANYAANRRAVVDLAHSRGKPLASHDDTTVDHVQEGLADGIGISEFPTTLEAARTAHAAGMGTLMGGPNVVMGGSHSGNVAAYELAEAGVLDGLASDYVPMSMVQATFILAENHAVPLPEAVAMASANPARMAGLDDRGEIAPGKRADLIRVTDYGHAPVVRSVWRAGTTVG